VSVITADWVAAIIDLKRDPKKIKSAKVGHRVQFGVGCEMIDFLNKYGICITVTDSLITRLPYLYALLANKSHPFCHPTMCKTFVGNFPIFVSFVRFLMDMSILEFDQVRLKLEDGFLTQRCDLTSKYDSAKNEYLRDCSSANTPSKAFEKLWAPKYSFGENFLVKVDELKKKKRRGTIKNFQLLALVLKTSLICWFMDCIMIMTQTVGNRTLATSSKLFEVGPVTPMVDAIQIFSTCK
jgi:hypothetical protein